MRHRSTAGRSGSRRACAWAAAVVLLTIAGLAAGCGGDTASPPATTSSATGLPPAATTELGRVSRFAGTPLPPDQVPADLAALFPPGSPVPAYLISTTAAGTVVGAVAPDGTVLVQAVMPGADATGPIGTQLEGVADRLASGKGAIVLGSSTDAAGRVNFAVFLLEDGFSDVTVAGTTYPVDGNAFVFTGTAGQDAVAEFHGPSRTARAPLLPS